TADQVAHARKLAKTESIRDIARSFGVSRTTLYRALADEA
ncbi:MAG: DNA invertase, partial [Rhodospirillales bacterium]